MKRGHTVIEYKSKIRKLREIRPDISLSSDFIIGFPGESEEDFNSTMNLIDEMCFDKSFSVIYSKRPGTIAASLPDDVDQTLKKQRLAVIQNKLNKNTEKISTDIVGPICESTDRLFSSNEFYDVKEGDLLAILNSGAYGSSMSSNYNVRPLVDEILIDKDNYNIIRNRQSFEESIAQEIKINKN